MKLLGTVIPFIGFKEEEVDEELARFMNLPDEVTHINTFQLAWLGCSVVIPLRAKE